MKHVIVLLLMLWTPAWSWSGRRTKRDVVCRDGMGYMHNGICCLNCPAGTFVKEACSKEMERSVCQQCEFDTYTEYDNGIFPSCLKCTKCRPEQEIVEQCNSTRNTRCQCKSGSFCLPDQACEICKMCRKCKQDEETVKNCTAHSNTVCQKRGPGSDSAVTMTGNKVAVISCGVFAAIVIMIGVCFLLWRKSAGCKKAVASRWPRGMGKTCIESGSELAEVKQNTMNGALEDGAQSQLLHGSTQPVGVDTTEDDEDNGLGPSLPNTTASSQTSLTLPSESRLGHSVLQQLNALENEKICKVVPINGDDSLKKSFDLFGEIDVTFHNRFFRLIGLNDNAIRTADMSCSSPEDRVYELLKVWMEKEGMKADFNSLIKALISLNQRLSAENITARAIECGYYRCKDNDVLMMQ